MVEVATATVTPEFELITLFPVPEIALTAPLLLAVVDVIEVDILGMALVVVAVGVGMVPGENGI